MHGEEAQSIHLGGIVKMQNSSSLVSPLSMDSQVCQYRLYTLCAKLLSIIPAQDRYER